MAAAAVLRAAKRSTGILAGTSLAGGAALYVYDRDAFETATRMCRTVTLATRMLADYSWHLWGQPGDGPGNDEALRGCHSRNAPLLRALVFRNGGIYIKLGQLLGLMDHILPEEYVNALRCCFDECPESSLSDVEAVFLEDLGQLPAQIFESFEACPFASASLAQVHRATLPGGRQMAVKVQHRALRRALRAEILGIDLVLRTVRLLQPAFGFEWLVEEVKENLPKELDFRLEAQNASRCRQILDMGGLSNAVVVPKTDDQLTTARILVMDFEEGHSLSSSAGAMQAAGVQPHAVVQRFSEAYAQMAFITGFLHSDPHPGNVLWRRKAGAPGGFQLVLLDHGLYRELPDEVRLAYCRLWYAIALADGEAALRAARSLGVRSEWLARKLAAEGGDGAGRIAAALDGAQEMSDNAETLAAKMLTAMLTARPYRAVADGRGGLLRFDRSYRSKSADEERKELGGHIAGYFRGILDVLDSLPRSMIFALKANDCLRAIASHLDVSPSVPLAVSCRACCRALALAGDSSAAGWRGWFLGLRCTLLLLLEGTVIAKVRRIRYVVAGA